MIQRKISILVVLYNKKIQDSATINSILQVPDRENLVLTIINNGPERLLDIEDFRFKNTGFASVNYKEYLENRSLSKIYNEFICENQDSQLYTFFDDDSLFDPTMIQNIANSKSDIILPLIKSQSDNEIYYPISDNNLVTSETALKVDGLISITSGLTVSRKLVDLMKTHYKLVFDERFALYGIDTSFFARLQKCSAIHNKLDLMCQGIILHSLSRASKKPISDFRLKERLCDAALIARHYPSFERNIYFLKKIIQNIYHLNYSNLSLLIKCYVSGKHPRS